ncbi:MAG: winged helix-turn-helix domain-containing protein, partial [Steroidobacteraceae bacterium]
MPHSHEYRFGTFQLDVEQRALFRGGNFVPLAPKLLETLIFLVERHGRIVEKQDLMEAVWRGLVVEEVGLAKNVSALRKILATDGDGRTYIETVPKRGYRFVAAVTETLGPASLALPSAADSGSARAEAPIDPAVQPRPTARDETESSGAPRIPSLPGKRWTRQRMVQLTFAILGGIVGLLLWQRIGIREPISPRRAMLAVLPVQNLTGDPGREYISDGMTEELITQLGSLDPERVGVIARTTSMLYKKTTKTVTQIGQELGVDYVLEGSLRTNAQRTRFTAQLVRTRDQSHLWAQEYDRDSQNLLALENEIGHTVAKEIGFRMTTQSPKRDERRRAVSPESHEAYLLARYYWNQGDEPSLRR